MAAFDVIVWYRRNETLIFLAKLIQILLKKVEGVWIPILYLQYLAAGDASTLAVLGSGVQARSHIQALSSIRSFKKVRLV